VNGAKGDQGLPGFPGIKGDKGNSGIPGIPGSLVLPKNSEIEYKKIDRLKKVKEGLQISRPER
jgi:hypothetical protein